MSSRVGRTLRFVGVALLVLLILELIVLSPRLFRMFTANSEEEPITAALPTAASAFSSRDVVEGKNEPPDVEATASSVAINVDAVDQEPTPIPTPTLVAVSTPEPEPITVEIQPTEVIVEAQVTEDETVGETDNSSAAEVAESEAVVEATASETSTDEAETVEVVTPQATTVTAESAESEPVVPLIAIPQPSQSNQDRANAFSINSIKFQTQHSYWTHAGPSVAAMMMTYWGQATTQYEVAAVVHGSAERVDDYNTTPLELAAYMNANEQVEAIVRYGGTLDLLRQMVFAGFPVIIQKSFPIPGDLGWSGHYLIVNGYNEQSNTFLTYDPYVGSYQNYAAMHIEDTWRAFNNTFIVTYTAEREAEMFDALTDWASEEWSVQRAHAVAVNEAAELQGLNQFFAQFNVGTSLTMMKQYEQASLAYDEAFTLHRSLRDFERPERIMWYQQGPYEAYYRTSRYQQIIDLASATITDAEYPYLEESFFWRGKAAEKVNNPDLAQSDLATAYQLNPALVSLDVDQ